MISKIAPRVSNGFRIVRAFAQRISPKTAPLLNKLPVLPSACKAIKIETAIPTHPLIAEVARLKGELEEAQAQLKQMTRRAETAEKLGQTDALTHLFNRGFGDMALSQAVSFAARNNQPLSLVIFDIDYFKTINDRFGHSVGDKVLFKVATTIKNALRSADIPFRYGGEEFVVILPDTQVSGAKIVAEKIRSLVQALKLKTEGEEFTITISGGIALFNENDVSKDLINRADRALYWSKENGRNQISTEELLSA